MNSDTKKAVNSSNPKPGPIAWIAGHSISANLFMLVLMIGGVMIGQRIKKEGFPDFQMDAVKIHMAYPGASPEEVERGLLLAIEEAIQDVQGIEAVYAKAQEGLGVVNVEVMEGQDAQQIARDIKNEVDRITSFPEEAEQAQIAVSRRKRYVVSLALYGDQTELLLREMAEMVRDRLLQDPEITRVEMKDAKDLEISIEIPQDTLRAYHLTRESVARTLRKSVVEMPGGAIKSASGDVLLRVIDRRDAAVDFGKIPIITAEDGNQVLLEEIATIRDGFEDIDSYATFNGKPAVMLEVYRVGNQTPVSVADAVIRKIPEIQKQLPDGVALEVHNDRSEFYRQRMDILLSNGYLGLALVFILLAFSLESRMAFWVSLGIPISILGSLFVLYVLDISINMISTFSFIVTLGIVVDDAIVVSENIFHHRQNGEDWYCAAVNGAREMVMPVSFSVLTNMIAFMPMLFVPGFMGKLFKQIPIVVISVFTVSLIESLFILPAHLAFKHRSTKNGLMGRFSQHQQRLSAYFRQQVRSKYGPLLERLLGWRYVIICLGMAVLIITSGYIKSGRMGFELFPRVESDFVKITANMPIGSAFKKTKEVQKIIVRAAQEVIAQHGGEQLGKGIYAILNDNSTIVHIYLTAPEIRPISTAHLTQLLRDKVGTPAGLKSIKFESDAGSPGSRGSAIEVELSHRDVAVVEQAGEKLANALTYYSNVADIDDGLSPGKQQIDIKIKPAGQSLGLQTNDVAQQIRNAYNGTEALRQQRGRNEIKIMVRLPASERDSEKSLEEMILHTPSGEEVLLREVVDFKHDRAFTSIDRHNGRRVVTVSADVHPRSETGHIISELKSGILPDLKHQYPGLSYRFQGRQADQRESMKALMDGLIFALVIIYSLLAMIFNSYIQPLIIMLVIPFGLVGAVVGHLVMGFSLSVISMFGLVALSGVIVNDSLVLIECANRFRRKGMDVERALIEAAINRFRPIFLTTATTFIGLVPMIFETSRQARFLIPMAISLGYGLLLGTAVTLVLVPSFYLMVEDFKRLPLLNIFERVVYESLKKR